MPTENKSSSVKSLIENLEFAEAAGLLQNALADRAADLSSEAQKLKIDIAQLESDIRQGILARDQVNIERARINRALIGLNSELARFEADPNYRHSKKEKAVLKNPTRLVWPVAAGLVALVLGVFYFTKTPAPTTFDIDVRLHEPGGGQKPVTEGQVNLRFGRPCHKNRTGSTGRARLFFVI